jgi:hypothetical protein
MSALWDLEVQSLNHTISVDRRFELRTVPQIFEKGYAGKLENMFDGLHLDVLSDTYQSSLQSWLYGAAVEISQSGSTPAWSKDSWSFIPLELEDIREALSSVKLNTLSVPGYSRNVTFETQGLRARLECQALDYPKNTSLWLEQIDLIDWRVDPATNQSARNATNNPPDVGYGYTLIGMANTGPRFGNYICCANETEGIPGDTAIGYWTNRPWVENADLFAGGRYGDFEQSMTAKLIVGRTFEKLYDESTYVWVEQPQLVLVNCTPVIEHARVSVFAELESGAVYDHEILGPIQNTTEAWTDDYLTHDTSVDYTGEWVPAYGADANVTTYANTTVR